MGILFYVGWDVWIMCCCMGSVYDCFVEGSCQISQLFVRGDWLGKGLVFLVDFFDDGGGGVVFYQVEYLYFVVVSFDDLCVDYLFDVVIVVFDQYVWMYLFEQVFGSVFGEVYYLVYCVEFGEYCYVLVY